MLFTGESFVGRKLSTSEPPPQMTPNQPKEDRNVGQTSGLLRISELLRMAALILTEMRQKPFLAHWTSAC